ncbi:acylneuraminate cytidylyltransferase family protein [Alphaproteobacteria bacterium]|nr:acylneuraminate cytidylyltransferase family protein [Alphaproteobacteria bacterium]
MTKDTVSIVIPARQGSKSIIDKNITLVDKHHLLEYSTLVAKQCKNIENIFVSTDSIEYQKKAIEFGVLAPFLRPVSISGDKSTDIEWFLNLFDEISYLNYNVSKYWVWLRPTSPLRDINVINQAINYMIKNKNADSLRSVHPMSESPYKFYESIDSNYLKPFGIKHTGVDYTSLNKQDLPTVWVPNGYVDIVKSENIIKNKEIYGDNIVKFETDYCIEIDSSEELEFINYHIKKYGNIVFKN